MAGANGERARTAALRLAAVCGHAEEVRADLRQGPAGDDGPLEQVLAAAREGRDVAAPAAALHAVLQAGGDPRGLDGYGPEGRRTRGGLRLAGVGDRPAEPVYLCPTRACARYWWPRGPAPVPVCAVSGAALIRDRL